MGISPDSSAIIPLRPSSLHPSWKPFEFLWQTRHRQCIILRVRLAAARPMKTTTQLQMLMDIEEVSSFVEPPRVHSLSFGFGGRERRREGGQTLAFWSISPAPSEAINLYERRVDHASLTTERGEERRAPLPIHCFSPFSVFISPHGPFSRVRIKPGKEDERRRRRRRRSADGEFNAAAIPCIN